MDGARRIGAVDAREWYSLNQRGVRMRIIMYRNFFEGVCVVSTGRGFIGLIAGYAFLMAACSSESTVTISKGDELANFNFSEPNSFEQGAYGDATLRVIDGVFRIDVPEGDATLWWGQWGDTYSDTVVEVDVEQITERNESAFGVMCRVRGSIGQPVEPDATLRAIVEATSEVMPDSTSEAEPEATSESTPEATSEATVEATSENTPEASDELTIDPRLNLEGDGYLFLIQGTGATVEATSENTPEASDELTIDPRLNLEGDGYLFLIQGTGAGAIFRSRGRDLQALADWRANDAIAIGASENRLRAVCAGTTLAFYVNDVLIAQVEDDAYAQGQVGLVAGASNRLGVRVHFDNLQISAVGGN